MEYGIGEKKMNNVFVKRDKKLAKQILDMERYYRRKHGYPMLRDSRAEMFADFYSAVGKKLKLKNVSEIQIYKDEITINHG